MSNQLELFLIFEGEKFYATKDASAEEMAKAICDQSDYGTTAIADGNTIYIKDYILDLEQALLVRIPDGPRVEWSAHDVSFDMKLKL